jgi:hypothetical protein
MSADRQARNATDFVEALKARTLRANRRGRLIEHAAIAVGRSLLIVAI